MNFFKELGLLIKWLFTGNPRKQETLQIEQFKHFPFKGYSAMSWCGHLITRYNPSYINKTVYNHETIHLLQAKRFRTWIGFYLSYLWQWFKINPFIGPSNCAYYTSPYEMEAYANEERPEYIENYDSSYIKTYYFIKNRRETFRKYGETISIWKLYLKATAPKL